MNTKKKHKNRPKQNPNVPSKVETEVKEEKIGDVLPKSDVKEEIPATAAVITPADVVEVVTPVVESVEVESETPKKPKRKGKRKNQDKENAEEDTAEKIQEIVQSEIPNTEKPVSIEGDDNKEQDENKSVEACVTPSARKKKNKKKLQEQVSQPPKIPEKEGCTIALAEKVEEIQKVDPEIQETIPPIAESIKPDTKSKKKNKKKNRNDSEKSDRSEEITCTSAFQKLLIEDEEPSDDADIKIVDTQTKANIDISTITPESEILECIPKSCDIDTTEEPLIFKKSNEDAVEVPKEENKNKKKNKKDNKYPYEDLQKEHIPPTPKEAESKMQQVMELIEPFKHQVVKEASPKPTLEALPDLEQDEGLFKLLKPQIERETSPKPKAKIAKPVEKKRKGEQDVPAVEILAKSTEDLTVMKAVMAPQERKKKCEQDVPAAEFLAKSTEDLTVMRAVMAPQERQASPLKNVGSKMTEEKFKASELIMEPQNLPLLVDTINVPDNKAQDKMRRKSPKPQKSKKKTDAKEELSPETKQTKIEPQPIEVISNLSKCDEEKEHSSAEHVTFSMCDEPFIPLQKSEKTEMNSPLDDIPPLVKIDESNISDNKAGKRKKKTPKFPLQADMTEATEIKQLITPEVSDSMEMPKSDEQYKKERVAESLAPLSDLEIQSVKTDDSGSSCDATPDVHFIRSSSHQLLDNNNNMVIHEVPNVEEIKPNESFIKPIIEGSGATPDLLSSGIQMTESKTTGKEEPTYLKSKMMEVNQDMEELRLSIERSLAEFSAMEQTEHKADKEYEPHRVECEKTFAGIEVAKPDAQMTSEVPVEQEKKAIESLNVAEAPPVCPARKDNKGKSKSKKKGKQETTPVISSTSACGTTSGDSKTTKDKQEKQEKTEQKTESTEKKGKQQSESTSKKEKQSDDIEQGSNHETHETEVPEDSNKLPISAQTFSDSLEQLDFAPIDNFEDALTSSIDDVNKSFEMIVDDNAEESQKNLAASKPEINITAPVDETESKKEKTKKDDKINPVSQPKNFLGHNDIPAQSNRTDYKKEKNKTPNERQAKVKIKDAMDVEAKKLSKESQTDIKRNKKMLDQTEKETFSRVKNDNEEYVYKYSFRKVFLQSACHICHKEIVQTRVPCSYCNLVFYCGAKHKDEDWPQHQALCFAVSTIVHLKDQKHIYADAQNITGQDYRLLRMQMIVSSEKVLKRRLVPWEQEAMLYPRMCGDAACREWRQAKLKDCEGCGQISYCADQPSHLPKSHQRWCKSYHLYSKLVGYQQTRGRLEPRLPKKVMRDCYLAEKMNEVLAAMYEEKIDMNDIQYAALTQIATAPLTAAYCYQLCINKMNYSNGVHKKTSFTIHVVGAELQFEADALNKWEVFFLHLRPDVDELRVVLISPVLNPGDLPLNLLGKIRLCDNCRQNKRRVVFSFQDKNYCEYRSSEEFVSPKLVCAFNPSIQRSSVYNGRDPWPNTINCIIKQKIPFIITGYTLTELRKDIARVKECAEIDFRVISEPVFNNFASVRPDRNFISDDDMPLLFKNYCVSVLCGC